MFQNLRQNNTIYVLHKDGQPRVDLASVVNVSVPVPRYPTPPSFGQPQELVVDVSVKVDGRDETYQKLPATADIADFGNGQMVISTSREAMNSEVSAIKQRALDVIASVDRNREIVAGCDSILSALNPEFAEKRQQQEEIADLKGRMDALSKNMEQLLTMVAKASGTGKNGSNKD